MVGLLGLLVLAGASLATAQGAPIQDPLLDKLAGKWHIARKVGERSEENTATGEWVVQHHYMRVSMKDVKEPAKYEAHIYITFEAESKRYVIHWMDVFAGSLPETLGYGHKVGDSIVFEWKDDDGVLRNTFAWHEATQTWTSTIEQAGKDGVFKNFCTDTYRRH